MRVVIDGEALMSAAEGVGIIAAGGFAGWQAFKARRRTERVERTLTTNNGGSHVKDALDRIEAEQRASRHEMSELRTDLREHVRDARAWERQTDDRLRAVEQARTKETT